MMAPHLPDDWRTVMATTVASSPNERAAASTISWLFGVPFDQALALVQAERARLQGRICL